MSAVAGRAIMVARPEEQLGSSKCSALAFLNTRSNMLVLLLCNLVPPSLLLAVTGDVTRVCLEDHDGLMTLLRGQSQSHSFFVQMRQVPQNLASLITYTVSRRQVKSIFLGSYGLSKARRIHAASLLHTACKKNGVQFSET